MVWFWSGCGAVHTSCASVINHLSKEVSLVGWMGDGQWAMGIKNRNLHGSGQEDGWL